MSSNNNNVRSLSRVHEEVHEGEYFEAADFSASLADDASLNLYFVAQAEAKPAHLTLLSGCGGDYSIEIFKNPTVNVLGTPITPENLNDYNPEVSLWSVYKGTTFTADGTEKIKFAVPGGTGGNASGGSSRSGLERIFAPSTAYMIRLTNLSGSAKIASILADWYEDEPE